MSQNWPIAFTIVGIVFAIAWVRVSYWKNIHYLERERNMKTRMHREEDRLDQKQEAEIVGMLSTE